MDAQTPRRGVLLLNVGTPDSPAVGDVRRYLRQFLMDPRVLDLPVASRWLLVNGAIVPFRAPKSAAQYRKVWTAAGSPLLVHGKALAAALSQRLGMPVAVGMAVGNPSITAALASLGDVESLAVVPLFPQYASATTGGVLEAVYRQVSLRPDVLPLTVLPPFFHDARWLDAVAAVALPSLRDFSPERVVFSYHGLPERQVKAMSPRCNLGSCCDAVVPFCYRSHCQATTRALAPRLGVGEPIHCYQSRLGKDPWLGPSTEETLRRLGAEGVKKVAVLCPSFVADCLETLEEIGKAGAEIFRAAGGGELLLLPAVNAEATWAEGLAGMIRELWR